jgi:TorA maturation chaperone TorD
MMRRRAPKQRQPGDRDAQPWLEAASRWRLLSLFFQLPTRATRRELRLLARSVPRELAALAGEWAGVPLKLAAAEFHRVLGAGGIPAVESSYDPNALAGRGPLLADIAGFHEAFAYRPGKPPAEVPDHIASQLDFLSYLSFKAAFALHEGQEENARIAIEAHHRFIEQHVATWLVAFRQKLDRSGSPFFIRAAAAIELPQAKAEARPKPRSLLPVLASILLLCFLVAPGWAQSSTPNVAQPGGQPAAAPAPAPARALRLGDVTFSGSLRGRMENWAWFESPPGEDSYTFGALNLRLAFEQKKERFEWRIEGLFPWLISLPENAILPSPQGQLGLGASYFAASGRQDGSAILRQAYVRFKWPTRGGASGLRIGRFEFADGAEVTPGDSTLATLKRDRIAHRLLGNFGFSHVGRGFDGLEYTWATKQSHLTLLAMRPTEGVFQLRSLKELDVDVYYAAYTRQFVGKKNRSEARAFALHYHDGRGALKTDNRPLAARAADLRNIRLSTFGGHALLVFDSGPHKTDLLLWGAAQYGRWGVLDHHAGAFAFELGHQFPGAWKPWLRGGFFRSTGDGEPADARHTTFFQILPTPRIYARFPFFNLMNNQDVFAEFRLKPAAKLAVRADARHLRLSNRRDLWYLGGGAFQEPTFGYVGRPSNQRAAMGTLIDLSLDYDFAAKSRLSFYFGGVRGGRVPSAIYPAGGSSPVARFLYVELLQQF